MFVRLMQATTITFALHVLLGLNTLNPGSATHTADSTIDGAEALVALKQVLIQR